MQANPTCISPPDFSSIGMEAVSDSESNQISCPIHTISLRPLLLSDIDAFMVWVSDIEVARFCTWDPFQSKEEGIKFIHNSVLPHPWFRAICVEDVPVGAIMVTENKNSGDRCRVELGYHLGSKYWGRGIVTEAVKLATAEVLKEMKEVERVEAYVEVENVRSQRVLEKAGYTREGVLRKHFRFKGRTRDFVLFSFLSAN